MASVTVSAMILAIMAMSKMFTQLLAARAQLMNSSDLWPTLVCAACNAVYHARSPVHSVYVHRHHRGHSADYSDLSADCDKP